MIEPVGSPESLRPSTSTAHLANPMVIAAGPTRPREVWIDSSRGACVLAVVLFHVCLWQYLPMSSTVWPAAIDGWSKINGYLASLRMPLLMAISGMLARRRILAGWRQPGAAVRAVSSYYLYVVWLVVYALFYLLVGDPRLPHHIDGLADFARQLVLPETPLWFILALAVYVVVLTTAHRVPPAVVLLVLTALAVAVVASDPDWPMFEKVPENFIYFALGVYGSSRLRTLVERRRGRDLLGALILGAGSIAIARWSFGTLGDAIVQVARGALFIVVGALVVVNLLRWRPLERLGSTVGRRTLQIYVFHAPIILTVVVILNDDRVRALSPLLRNPVVAVAWPLLLSAVVVACSLLLYRLLVTLGLGAMFQMPTSLAAAITRRWRPQTPEPRDSVSFPSRTHVPPASLPQRSSTDGDTTS